MRTLAIGLLLFIFTLFSCDAPRENPFDPGSDNYYQPPEQTVVSTVTVKQLYPPFNPIANAQVIEPHLQLFGITNNKGEIQFEHQPVDSLTFMVSAEPFFPDTLSFKRKTSNEYEIYLNARPQIQNVVFKSFYNYVDEQFSFTSLYTELLVTDLDGSLDIDRVTLHNTAYQFDTTLARDANNSDLFKLEFPLRNISSEITPEEVPELNFELIVKNKNNDQIVSGPYTIKRVINVTLIQVRPSISEVTQDSVVFEWVDPELPFDYTFNIVLLKFPTVDEVFYKGIPKGQTRFVLNNISPGQYNWKLQLEDRLGNICQSNYINFYHE